MKRSDIAVILPAYNEAASIRGVLKDLQKTSLDVVVVDDGSTDETAENARSIADYMLQHPLNLGKGAAMKTGAYFAFHTLDKKAVVFLDADGQHNTQEISGFLNALEEGFPLVFGVRELSEEMPKVRVMSNRLLSYTVQALFGTYIPDILCGYKAMTRHGFSQVHWSAVSYDVELEIAVNAMKKNIPLKTVPISTRYFNLDRGMNILHSLQLVQKLLNLRILSK